MLKLMRAPAKYIQGKDALLSTYGETKNLGTSFLFICSRSGEKTCRAHLEQSFAGKEAAIRFEIFGGHSSEGEIQRMRDIVRAHGIDCVAGVGGGSAIDTAKATAYYEGLPVLVIPTVSATDAPCTGLSVIYKDDGSFSKYLFYPKNPDVVLVDSTVIANAPVKFLVAGMGDALGTYFEARMCARAKAPSLENGGITRSALALCRLCYETLLENGARAKAPWSGICSPRMWRRSLRPISTSRAWARTTAACAWPTPCTTASPPWKNALRPTAAWWPSAPSCNCCWKTRPARNCARCRTSV